jgi:glycosyltransferase involved in cell wall biosynthesis
MSQKSPKPVLVSVIIPTKNSEKYLQKCLESIKKQTFKDFEIILVDNFSEDKTREIAKKYTDKIFLQGPERSAQTNFGVSKASGKYIYKVDSDFVLEPDVIKECVQEIEKGFDAIVVHNSLDESVSFLAKIRNFEVSMYKYDLAHSSARFVKKDVYQKIGGFNPKITAGEDYDFQRKLNQNGFKTGFIKAEALHLDEPRNRDFFKLMKKFFYYGVDSVNYFQKNKQEITKQTMRFVYFKHLHKFIKHPILALGFVFYMFSKFLFGGAGLVYAKLLKK